MSKARPNLTKGETALKKLLAAASNPESVKIIPALRKYVMEHCNELGHCPFCSSPIKDVVQTFTQETAKDTVRILYNWCQEKGRNEFSTGEIKHLLNHTQYANLNHLVALGGIVYRPRNPRTGRPYRSGHYGLHRGRAGEFLSNLRPAPVQITRNRFTGERENAVEAPASEMPRVVDLLDSEGNYKQPELLS